MLGPCLSSHEPKHVLLFHIHKEAHPVHLQRFSGADEGHLREHCAPWTYSSWLNRKGRGVACDRTVFSTDTTMLVFFALIWKKGLRIKLIKIYLQCVRIFCYYCKHILLKFCEMILTLSHANFKHKNEFIKEQCHWLHTCRWWKSLWFYNVQCKAPGFHTINLRRKDGGRKSVSRSHSASGGHKTLLHCAIRATIGGAWLQVSGWQSKTYEQWSQWTSVLWRVTWTMNSKLLNGSEIYFKADMLQRILWRRLWYCAIIQYPVSPYLLGHHTQYYKV